jgi:DNA modification methylase
MDDPYDTDVHLKHSYFPFGLFPSGIAEKLILASSPEDGVVLDPFCGIGSVGLQAVRLGRRFVGIELNPDFAIQAASRIKSGE